MTYLDLVNAVLRRVREAEVASVTTTDYSKLIGDMVNEAKRAVEDAWNWSILRTTKTIYTSPINLSNYEITDSNFRTRVLHIYLPSEKRDLQQVSQDVMHRNIDLLGTQTGSPMQFSYGPITSAGKLTIDIFPIPAQVYTIKAECVIPEAELVADLDNTVLPSELIIQGAYLRAINERGEDGGRLSDQQLLIYERTLASYISIETSRYEDEITWEPV
jgi:hypothetical protein